MMGNEGHISPMAGMQVIISLVGCGDMHDDVAGDDGDEQHAAQRHGRRHERDEQRDAGDLCHDHNNQTYDQL